MWHRDTKWAKDVRKNGPGGLAQCKVATNLPFVKKKKKAVSGKCNKTRYPCSKYRQKIQREI